RHCHRVARGPRREDLHADPGDAGKCKPDPHAAPQQREQRDDEKHGDQRVHAKWPVVAAYAGTLSSQDTGWPYLEAPAFGPVWPFLETSPPTRPLWPYLETSPLTGSVLPPARKRQCWS